MKIYRMHANSNENVQFFECRAMRGDGTIFLVNLTRYIQTESGDVTTVYVSRLDLLGEMHITDLLRDEIQTSGLLLYTTTPCRVGTMTRHPWKKIASRDALNILKTVSSKVELSDDLFAGENARRVFGFKKTGERSVNPR